MSGTETTLACPAIGVGLASRTTALNAAVGDTNIIVNLGSELTLRIGLALVRLTYSHRRAVGGSKTEHVVSSASLLKRARIFFEWRPYDGKRRIAEI